MMSIDWVTRVRIERMCVGILEGIAPRRLTAPQIAAEIDKPVESVWLILQDLNMQKRVAYRMNRYALGRVDAQSFFVPVKKIRVKYPWETKKEELKQSSV